MDDILAALAAQHAELAGLLAGVDDDGWRRPSPCEGWDVADVVLHLVQTDQMALASLHGHLAGTVAAMTAGGFASNVDEGAALIVARERGLPNDELRQRWQDGADALDAAFASTDLHQRVEWVAGQLSARTLATTRLAETWIHTGDVATALGRPLPIPDRVRHIARLAWRTLPYAFGRAGRTLAGPVAFELRGPNGDAWIFTPDEPTVTTIRGDAGELCLVAARRTNPADTALTGEGPDAAAVLDLVRTYA